MLGMVLLMPDMVPQRPDMEPLMQVTELLMLATEPLLLDMELLIPVTPVLTADTPPLSPDTPGAGGQWVSLRTRSSLRHCETSARAPGSSAGQPRSESSRGSITGTGPALLTLTAHSDLSRILVLV